jgi:tetratricopeptide (TPR) repeat protein
VIILTEEGSEEGSGEHSDLAYLFTDAPFEYRPEHDVYYLALQQVWEDGILTDDEKRMLNGLQESLNISQNEHEYIESKVEIGKPKENLNTYKRVLEQAWADGILTADEQSMLSNLKGQLQITDEEHQMLEEEVKGNIPSKPIQLEEGDENDAGYWIRKGEDLWANSDGNAHDAQNAIIYFDNAIRLDPLNYYAWVNKGLILKKLDKREDALLCYDRAIQIQPDYPNSWFNKGVLLGCMGKLEEAVKCFEKVLEIVPDHQLALRDKQMLTEIINRKQTSLIKTRTLKLK